MNEHSAATSLYASEPTRAKAPELTLTDEQFERLRDLLARYGGVYLDTARQRVLASGLAQRLLATGDDLESYEQRLRGPDGRDELRRLTEHVLNHETFFFRNKPHIRALQEVLLPELQRRKPGGEPIRIWSAGCATGEVPYSLAITLLETLGPQASRTCSVWATDMSQAAVAHARAGYYEGRALGNLTPALLARYFMPHGAGYVVNDTLRAMVQFDTQNLLDPFPSNVQGVDIIFCQNVMIYFQFDTCRALLERFYACLPPKGLLFLGFSETLWNVFDKFQSREVLGAYVYTKETQPQPAATLPDARATCVSQVNKPATGTLSRARPAQLPAASALSQPASDSDHDVLRQAHALLQGGRADQALEVLGNILPGSPVAAQALCLVARVHADRGDLDRAAAEAQRAIELNQMVEDAYLLLGVIAGRQKQWGRAIYQFEKARYLQPAAPLISFYLAEAHAQLGHRDVAAREYRATLWKLRDYDATHELDGVAVDWLRRTCEQQIAQHIKHP